MAEKKKTVAKQAAKKNQKQELKQLRPHHRACIELLVEGRDPDYVIAQQIGVDNATLSRWKKSKVFAEELERRIKEEERYRRMRYRAQANRAAERLMELMESKHPTTAIAATREVLRLAGDGIEPEEKPSVTGGIIILPPIKDKGDGI